MISNTQSPLSPLPNWVSGGDEHINYKQIVNKLKKSASTSYTVKTDNYHYQLRGIVIWVMIRDEYCFPYYTIGFPITDYILTNSIRGKKVTDWLQDTALLTCTPLHSPTHLTLTYGELLWRLLNEPTEELDIFPHKVEPTKYTIHTLRGNKGCWLIPPRRGDDLSTSTPTPTSTPLIPSQLKEFGEDYITIPHRDRWTLKTRHCKGIIDDSYWGIETKRTIHCKKIEKPVRINFKLTGTSSSLTHTSIPLSQLQGIGEMIF